jgi:hypothetical protein
VGGRHLQATIVDLVREGVAAGLTIEQAAVVIRRLLQVCARAGRPLLSHLLRSTRPSSPRLYSGGYRIRHHCRNTVHGYCN